MANAHAGNLTPKSMKAAENTASSCLPVGYWYLKF